MKEEDPNPSGFDPFSKKKMKIPTNSVANEAKELAPSQSPSLLISYFSLKSRQDRIAPNETFNLIRNSYSCFIVKCLCTFIYI